VTGLLWLFFSYGYALYYASNLIGEGSELLLLVPSMAGLVGGVVLPLLGAVPDGGKLTRLLVNMEASVSILARLQASGIISPSASASIFFFF
jgi:hypothetical protein